MAFVYDKHHSLGYNLLYFGFFLRKLLGIHLAHLLYGSHYQKIFPWSIVIQFSYQIIRVFRRLYIIHRISKRTIFIQGLCSKFYSIDKKHNFICIPRLCNQLSRFKTGHSLSATCRMPDIATFLLRTLPIPFCNNGTNLTGSIILIASQYF